MLYYDLVNLQDLMVGSSDVEQLMKRSTKAAMVRYYLAWAIEPPEPEKEEG